MAVEMVEIVNPETGLKGLVAATSKAARLYQRPPSANAAGNNTDGDNTNGDEGGEPAAPDTSEAKPATPKPPKGA